MKPEMDESGGNTMNAADAFEQNRAQLETQLRGAGSLEEAVAACTMALERTA